MADDWEDWEADEYEPQLPAVVVASNGVAEITKGSKLLTDDPDPTKFAGEDEEEDRPSWEGSVPKSQKKKEVIKKYDESKGARADDTPLDDPVLEKLRQQRLIEESDYAATMELFGDVANIDLDGMLPKSAKDFELFAEGLAAKYLMPHRDSQHYKLLVKQVMRRALAPMAVQETKDMETALAGIRAEKVKEEKALAAAANKGKKKKVLNVGRSGGSAGLDDYQFGDEALDDEFDFM